MFRQHIKTAFRNLWKNKVFTAINFVGLILRLSAIMVLSVMGYQFLTFDSIHTSKSRMAYLKTKNKDGNEYAQTTFPLLYVAFLTIFIACMGMLGLITVFARQRVKEIGVRKVLGANAPDILRLLSKNFLLMGVLAAIIAAPLAWLVMNGWLQNFAYRISVNGWMLVGGALIAIAIVAVTVGFQSVKAALANPVKSLRTE